MGFLQSAINQVGRDMGRVASNAIFKDRHSIPIRRAKSFHSSHSSSRQRPVRAKAQPIQQVQDEFERAIDFKTGYRPTTLISKLGGAFVVIKNEARAFVDDGYLDVEESQQLFRMMKQFSNKCSDVEDVVGFTEDEDSKTYKQLEKIHNSTKEVFVEVLEISAKACLLRAIEYEKAAKEMKTISFSRYVGLHLIWMPNYAKGGEKNVNKAIIANILDVITLAFIFTRPVLLIIGLLTYSGQKRKTQEAINGYKELAEQERERAKAYQDFVSDNS